MARQRGSRNLHSKFISGFMCTLIIYSFISTSRLLASCSCVVTAIFSDLRSIDGMETVNWSFRCWYWLEKLWVGGFGESGHAKADHRNPFTLDEVVGLTLWRHCLRSSCHSLVSKRKTRNPLQTKTWKLIKNIKASPEFLKKLFFWLLYPLTSSQKHLKRLAFDSIISKQLRSRASERMAFEMQFSPSLLGS